jgi:hypothetical protein
LHGKILLEPANINRANAANRAVAVTFNSLPASVRRPNDLILMNAGIAKPIPQFLVYSTGWSLIPLKRLLQRGP